MKGIKLKTQTLNPHTHEDLIFDEEAKNTHWREGSILNKWCWSKWMAAHSRMQIGPYISPSQSSTPREARTSV